LGGTVTISGKEARQNNGASKIVDLLKAKTDQLQKTLTQTLGQALFTASSDSGSQIHSITDIMSTTATFGGLSKTTYSWWQPQTGTAASFAANGVDTMRTIFNSCTLQDQADKPNLIVTTQTVFEYYEKVLLPQERFQDSKTADAGFQNLLFKGVPITWDYYCTALRMYFLNTNYIDLNVHTQADMKFGEFQEPENQDAKVAKCIWMGELTASNCQKQGVMTITAA
jgi:hypothetical protein